MSDVEGREMGEWLRDAFAGCPYTDEVIEAVRLEYPGISNRELAAAMRSAAALAESLATRHVRDDDDGLEKAVAAEYREHAALLRAAAAALSPPPRRGA